MKRDYHHARAWVGDTELAVIFDQPGTISLDDTYAPFIRGTITVGTPADTSILDPSTPTRLRIRLEQEFVPLEDRVYNLTDLHGSTGTVADLTTYYGSTGTVADLSLTVPSDWVEGTAREFDLHVRSVSHRLIDGTTTIRFASDEALWQDRIAINVGDNNPPIVGSYADEVSYIPNSGQFVLPPFTLAVLADRVAIGLDVVARLLQTPLVPPGADETRPDAQLLRFDAGDSLYDAVDNLAQKLGYRMVSESGAGVQFVRRDRTIDGTITLDAAENLLDFTITQDRDHSDWYDSVLIPIDDDPVQYIGRRGTKGYTEDLTRVTGRRGVIAAWESATALVDSFIDRTEKRLQRSPAFAVNDYAALPGQAVAIDLGARTFTAVAESVEWQIGGDWNMTITCRDLEETTP